MRLELGGKTILLLRLPQAEILVTRLCYLSVQAAENQFLS